MKNVIDKTVKNVYRYRLHKDGMPFPGINKYDLKEACDFSHNYRNPFMKKPQESEVTNTYIVQPPQTNAHGTAFGGQIMAWMDETAAITAFRHAGMPCVTVAVDQVHFNKPIAMGHIVIMKSRVNFTGRSSMEVGVRVCSEDPITGLKQHCLTGYLTFVSVDGTGKPVEVPAIQPDSAEDIRRYDEGKKRRKIRLANKT